METLFGKFYIKAFIILDTKANWQPARFKNNNKVGKTAL